MSAYAAETLQDLTKEMAAAKGRISQVVSFTCQTLSNDKRRELIDILHDIVDDQYYPHTAPLQAELDEAASMRAHRQRQSDIADYHSRVL